MNKKFLKKISMNDFNKVDIRVGTILSCELLKRAKKTSYKLQIDFGEIGIKKSSAQITSYYSPESLIDKQIIGIINLAPKQIANIMSEVLVLGIIDVDEKVVLLHPSQKVRNGLRIS